MHCSFETLGQLSSLMELSTRAHLGPAAKVTARGPSRVAVFSLPVLPVAAAIGVVVAEPSDRFASEQD